MGFNESKIRRNANGKFAPKPKNGKRPPDSGGAGYAIPLSPTEPDGGGKKNTIDGAYERYNTATAEPDTGIGVGDSARIGGKYRIAGGDSEGVVGSEGEYRKPAGPKNPPSMRRGDAEWEKFNAAILRNPNIPASELKAQMVAAAAHRGQTDQVGADYILHPAGVAKLMEQTDAYKQLDGGQQRAARQAAWLHDTLEDTAVNIDDLRDAGFDDDVVTAVEAVTARKGEPKPEYYERVKAAGPVAVAVKLGDLSHNNLPGRRANLPGSPSNPVPPESVGDPAVDRWTKLGRKYFIAYKALGAEPPPHLQQFAPK